MFTSKLSCVVGVLLLLLAFRYCLGLAKFTNIKCASMDDNLVSFALCRLKAVKRDVNELSLSMKVLAPPDQLRHLTMRWQLLKKASGYKPFLYDISVDLCEYLSKRNHPFLNIIFNTFNNHSTGLKKCPLNDEITLDRFRFPSKALIFIPLPPGEYALFGTFCADGKECVSINIYFILTEF